MGVKSEMSSVNNVDVSSRYVFAITFRLAGIERLFMFAPDDKQSGLLFLQPCLPLGIVRNVGPIIVEEIALNLRLPRSIQEPVFIDPEIGVVEFHPGIVTDMASFRGIERKQIFSQCLFVRRASAQNARRVAQFAPKPSL